MAKKCWRYRCLRRVDGHTCFTRKSFPQPLAWYSSPGRVPKCPRCGSRSHWYYDRHRDTVELRRQLCRCGNAPYPHRRGTRAEGGRFGSWECVDFVPF